MFVAVMQANVDLEKTFGVSARFAATARAVYEAWSRTWEA